MPLNLVWLGSYFKCDEKICGFGDYACSCSCWCLLERLCCWFSRCKIEYVVREKEVIKYVEKKKADIYVKPNASRIDLLQLMHDGKL